MALDSRYDVWPQPHERTFYHPWHDCQRLADEFDAEKDKAREFFLPQHKALGAERDDPGALAIYERHRIVERQIADKLYCDVAAFAESVQRDDLAGKLRRTALKMFDCRTSGGFGIGPAGRPIIAWDSKCSCSKLCPDEARNEGQRLFDRYANVIADHAKHGGRVYKAWFTIPNPDRGELAPAQQFLFRRFRNKILRTVRKGENRFGIVGALAVLEAPLSERRNWNLHLNVILLTKGWLDYKALRDQWAANMEITQHSDFKEKGMHGLFREMVKYAVQSAPAKSIDKRAKQKSDAPAFIDWTPGEILEWYTANENFRRTRAYGVLHGIGKPDRSHFKPRAWLGRLDWQPAGYRITWRGHNLDYIARSLLDDGGCALDLIRGDKSTGLTDFKRATGPPRWQSERPRKQYKKMGR